MNFFRRYLIRLSSLRQKRPLVGLSNDVKLLRRVSGAGRPTWRQFRHMVHMMQKKERILYYAGVFGVALSIIWAVVITVNIFRVEVPAVGGRYVEGIVGNVQRLNPIYAPLSDAEMDITKLLFSGLLRVDTKGRLVPDLAASYQVSEDKKVYTFVLRNDARWHDGKPVTARDVAFTIETIQQPEVGSPLLPSFQGVSVNAVDDYNIIFTLAEPFSSFANALAVGIIPEHIWSDTPVATIALTQKNLQPVGSGPFQLHTLVKDDSGVVTHMELQRFDDYYRQPPFLKEIFFDFFSTYDGDAGVISALRQDRVDGIHFVPNAFKDKVARKGITIHTIQFPQYTALFLNQKSNVIKQTAVREALALSIDKERLLKEVLNNNGFMVEGPLLPGFPGFTENVSTTPFSLEQANALLDKAWPRLSADAYREERKTVLLSAIVTSTPTASTTIDDTAVSSTQAIQLANIEEQLNSELSEAQTFYRKNSAGEVLKISFVTVDTAEYRAAAERIAGFWQEIGVKTEMSFVSVKDFSRFVLKPHNYDVLLYGVVLGSDPDQFPFWHSSQIGYPGLNLSQYSNVAVDGLLTKARSTSDVAEQEKSYAEIQKIILTDRAAIFLFSPTYSYALPSNIKGTEFSRVYVPSDRFAGVIHWFIKTKSSWRWPDTK